MPTVGKKRIKDLGDPDLARINRELRAEIRRRGITPAKERRMINQVRRRIGLKELRNAK